MNWQALESKWISIAAAWVIVWMGSGAATAQAQREPMVRFLPGDRFTSVAESPLGLLVDGAGASLDPERLRALGERLSLVTWPEGTPVAGAVGVRAEAETWQHAQVLFTPKAPPADRWYLLRLTGIPEGFALAGDAHRLSDGTWGVRFRTGPQLILRGARACRDKEGLVVQADFSERVSAAPLSRAFRVTQGGRPVACALPPQGENAPPVPESAKAGFEEGLAGIELHCPSAVADQPVDLALTSELRSIGGLAAGGPEEPALYHLRAPRDWQGNSGCQEVLP